MDKLKGDQLRDELRTAGVLLVICAGVIGWLAASVWGWVGAAWIAACGVGVMVRK